MRQNAVMLCTIYKLRDRGRKSSADEVKATGVVALLAFGPHPLHPYARVSMLNPATSVSMGDLDIAVVKRIDARGIMVSGHESRPSEVSTWQTWWCVPIVREPIM